MYYKLTPKQKDEIRRLTQQANRRIRRAMKVFEKAGHDIVPREIAGRHQTRDTWHTEKTPISRSVRFESEEAYRRQLSYLRTFDPQRGERPGIREYTKVQRAKTIEAIETATGEPPSPKLQRKIQSMSAPELDEFWWDFDRRATRMGAQYSSNAVMNALLQDYFPEDISYLQEGIA